MALELPDTAFADHGERTPGVTRVLGTRIELAASDSRDAFRTSYAAASRASH